MRDWNSYAKGVLRGEMAKRHMKATDLAKALEAIGIQERPENVKNKIGRGLFSAAFFLQCMVAMEVKEIHLH